MSSYQLRARLHNNTSIAVSFYRPLSIRSLSLSIAKFFVLVFSVLFFFSFAFDSVFFTLALDLLSLLSTSHFYSPHLFVKQITKSPTNIKIQITFVHRANIDVMPLERLVYSHVKHDLKHVQHNIALHLADCKHILCILRIFLAIVKQLKWKEITSIKTHSDKWKQKLDFSTSKLHFHKAIICDALNNLQLKYFWKCLFEWWMAFLMEKFGRLFFYRFTDWKKNKHGKLLMEKTRDFNWKLLGIEARKYIDVN